MQTAARHVQSEGLLGSSTLCLLTINLQQGRLAAANLGDSGFMVLGPPLGQPGGPPAVRYRTVQLEHEFGRPYQLGHHAHASKPEDAELVSLALQPGDTIVMGSDGLFDNVAESAILAESAR
jgi:protein phosphatase PTC7